MISAGLICIYDDSIDHGDACNDPAFRGHIQVDKKTKYNSFNNT